MHRHQLRRALEGYRRADGNWRLKGLLLALEEGASKVGSVWPRPDPEQSRDYVALGARAGDVAEEAIARSLYDADQVTSGAFVPRDEYIARSLVSESATELDVLWREEIHETVAAGAATRKMAREATTVTEVDARKGDIPTREQESFATTGAEGASGSFDGQDYTQTAYDCEVHESGFAVSDELVDQAAIGQIEEQMQQAGAAVENAINRQYLLNVVDNAGQDNGSVGNEATVQTVMEAAENVSDNDFDPVDGLVMHPEFRTELADDPALASADWAGDATDGVVGSAFGLGLYVASGATYNGLSTEHVGGSNTWGWNAASEIGGVVHSSEFVHTVVYRDIDISELQAPYTDIHDVVGGVARAWTDSVQASNDAISTITQ